MRLFLREGPFHSGDSFRELVSLWAELGLVEVEQGPDIFVWAGEPGRILLFDYDRLDDREIPPFEAVLLGNTVVDCPVCHPWILWARSPRLIREARTRSIPGLQERDIESVFLGKIENDVQARNRPQDWASAGIELYHCPVDLPGPDHYMFTKQEYLEKLRQSRFGLCLPGYGPKCNREIELLGMGAVPLFAPGVDTTYAEPLVEGVHFLAVQSPADVVPTIRGVSEDQWAQLQADGTAWYERNASAEGAFEVTRRIVEPLLAG